MDNTKPDIVIEETISSIVWVIVISFLISLATLLFVLYDWINEKHNESKMNHYYYGGNGLELHEAILWENMY